ncbi:hypothetical protein PLEOSDRAFT_170734 [Pleurotus ostreatus PC15]|uniref:Secreted protein n=1 Tax=Pleurotus ostreatus (strain PC15) TaxID=1137138 RepID=A0A067N8I9_PLEO1|nr:hypothetical protein PLEOSDRAFT_170734 [Pleurotus ostreatus PC15]
MVVVEVLVVRAVVVVATSCCRQPILHSTRTGATATKSPDGDDFDGGNSSKACGKWQKVGWRETAPCSSYMPVGKADGAVSYKRGRDRELGALGAMDGWRDELGIEKRGRTGQLTCYVCDWQTTPGTSTSTKRQPGDSLERQTADYPSTVTLRRHYGHCHRAPCAHSQGSLREAASATNTERGVEALERGTPRERKIEPAKEATGKTIKRRRGRGE